VTKQTVFIGLSRDHTRHWFVADNFSIFEPDYAVAVGGDV